GQGGLAPGRGTLPAPAPTPLPPGSKPLPILECYSLDRSDCWNSTSNRTWTTARKMPEMPAILAVTSRLRQVSGYRLLNALSPVQRVRAVVPESFPAGPPPAAHQTQVRSAAPRPCIPSGQPASLRAPTPGETGHAPIGVARLANARHRRPAASLPVAARLLSRDDAERFALLDELPRPAQPVG